MNAPRRNGARSLANGMGGWAVSAVLGVALLGMAAESRPLQEDPPVQTQALPYTPGYGTSDSNGSMIAVTGVDVTGGSILYLVDTESRHLTVYQATGGTRSTMNLKWVGARNIDLDLAVDGWNDESQYTYKELAAEFAKQTDPPSLKSR